MGFDASTVTVHANAPVPDPVVPAGMRARCWIVNVGTCPVWLADRTVDPVNGIRLLIGDRIELRDPAGVYARVRGDNDGKLHYVVEESGGPG